MFYLIVGPTCSGKDKIANYIIGKYSNISSIISTTSRPIRPKEKEGLEYHFLSVEEFIKRVNEDGFIEHRSYDTIVNDVKDTWYYGVEKRSVANSEMDYVAVISYQGAMKFREYFGNENTILVYIKSLYSDRYVRNILRGDFDLSEWTRRNRDDAEWLSQAESIADVVISNSGFDYPEQSFSQDLYIDLDSSEYQETFEDTKKFIDFLIKDFSKNRQE